MTSPACAIGRPTPPPVTGTLTTGRGYRLTGDGETAYLAPCHPDEWHPFDWYDCALGLAGLLRSTVPEADQQRGRFEISVTFHPDPCSGAPECEPYHGRTCRDGRAWDAPPPEGDPCQDERTPLLATAG